MKPRRRKRVSYFTILTVLYLLALGVLLRYRIDVQYMTPDEKIYTDFTLIDYASQSGISLNSADGALGFRYLVASYYFTWLSSIGGRYLIFAANALTLLSALYVLWRQSRKELGVPTVYYFAFLFLLPSVLFFSLAALRDIYTYAAGILLLSRADANPQQRGFDPWIIGALVLCACTAPFRAILFAAALFMSKCRPRYVAAAVLSFYILFLLCMVLPYLHSGVSTFPPIQQWLSFRQFDGLPFGVLGEEAGIACNNATIMLANWGLALMPYLLLRNVSSPLDWAFFLQSVAMLGLLPRFVANMFRLRTFFPLDRRFRFSLISLLLIHPLLFKERDASSLLRHSMILLPYFIYIVLSSTKRLYQRRRIQITGSPA